MDMQIWRHRRPLERLKRAISSGRVTVGFLGGSITEARPGHNWPEKVVSWLADRYPSVRFIIENAAIGATGSDLAVFRAERDIMRYDCDVVFVEYAVNDYYTASDMRKKTREGLIRQLAAWDRADLVFVYTYLQAMYQAMSADEMPDSIVEFERLADHYNIGSVWMGLHAFREVQRGVMTWEEWLPDGLHPTHRGSWSYAQSVIAFLERELDSAEAAIPQAGTGAALPQPLDPSHWQHASFVPFSEVETEGPWTVQRSSTIVWIDQMLVTSAVGAKMRFSFTGRGLALAFDFGKLAADFRYRIDGGEAQLLSRDRPDWCPNEGWFRLTTLADDLQPGKHEVEIEVIHGDTPQCTGTRFKLAFIGVVG